ncbi:hypothetical protein CPB84DRAFT_962527 [Gymnopilus junonius]|uniref:Uncharacterized protein n=1 Tax=Gymnopilus junonius TaxID=109634 RepID=A0A9P5TEK9_GYMJU|nr:hypothetical protein CPB84DRAFT_962527 [Gymnopilus junonius]
MQSAQRMGSNTEFFSFYAIVPCLKTEESIRGPSQILHRVSRVEGAMPSYDPLKSASICSDHGVMLCGLSNLFRPSIDPSQLRRLKLSDQQSTLIDDFNPLLTLEELNFWVDQYIIGTHQPSYPKQPLDLGSFNKLQYLTICSYIHPYIQPSRDQDNDISYIAVTLRSLPFPLLHHEQV